MVLQDAIHSPISGEITQLRKRHNLTRAAFGMLTGVHSNTVQRWEGARTKMPAGLWLLANLVLEVPAVAAARRDWLARRK